MINKFILGTVQFGLDYGINNPKGKPTPYQVFKMLEYAASKGIDVLDTADAYGNAIELLGNFNKTHQCLFSINTKFKNNHESLSEQLENTLNLLFIEKINTYFYHNFNDFINYPKHLISLISLKQKNLIKKIGVSVYNNDEFQIIINTPEIDVIQFPFNLLDNLNQRGNLIKLAKEKGKELQVRSVFLQGLFFKSISTLPLKLVPLKPYLLTINEIATENHITIEQLALSYAISQPEIDKVIIGVDNLEQLKTNINTFENMITNDIRDRINEINVKEVSLLYPKNW